MLHASGDVSIDDDKNNIVDDELHKGSGHNVVSPDNGSSRTHSSGFSFNLCYIVDSLPSICGKPSQLSPFRKASPVAVVVEDDEYDEGVEVAQKNDGSNLIHHGGVDPMNVESYITVHLPKPIGIRFEENNSKSGVFVADIDNTAANESIRRGYQLIAVGEKRVSGLGFDEAVMKPIVDKVEAEVTLVFFTGSAEELYHPSSGATEEWLDNFVAVNAKQQNMTNVENVNFGEEFLANTSCDVCDDDVTNEVLEESNEDVQGGIVEQPETTEYGELDVERSLAFDELNPVGGFDIIHDETNYDFFAKVPDLSTSSLFDWTPKKNRMPDVDSVTGLFEVEKENALVNETNPWRLPDFSAIESSEDDALGFSTPTRAAVEESSVSVEANDDAFVKVGESNDGNGASMIESALGGGQKDNAVMKNFSVDQCTYIEKEGNSVLPHSDASYTPSSGFVLRKNIELPEISEDEVLIRVDASTISTRDCLERLRRENKEKLKDESWVPGHEIVGRVVKAGVKAKFLLNRRVASLLPYGGGCARYVCSHAKDLISLPETADSIEMVALLSTYMAAYQCLECIKRNNDLDPVGPSLNIAVYESESIQEENPSPTEIGAQKRSPLSGSCVLITGAGSPVGLALIDIARHAGAIVYALSHSSYEQAIREIGVKEWYPLFRKNEWKAEWKGKMDVIIDTIGDYDNYTSFYEVTAPRGRFVRVNTTSCEKKYVPILTGIQGERDKVFSLLKDYKGSRINNMAIDYNVFHSFNDDQELFTEDLAYLYHLLQIGKIEPKVFSRVGFDELEEEWKKVMGGGANGVVVVSPWKE
ncbi:hypothetical protein ACHAXM_002123 [Skeletonema potamos]|jgi:NADPH:quinone reductase-like Zn-dependent oxidoreductase